MRTLAREKVNEKNMITNYDAHGFMVAAEELPKACTACPFWLVEAEKFEEGECFLTGHIIKSTKNLMPRNRLGNMRIR